MVLQQNVPMQAAMDGLERFVARQTEHLTGGGFETKGSDSQIVADAVAREFPDMQAEDLVSASRVDGDSSDSGF